MVLTACVLAGRACVQLVLLSGRGDDYLPSAHTCFFTIDLPGYSSVAVMRSKLLYAIRQCAAIDCESTHPSGTLFVPPTVLACTACGSCGARLSCCMRERHAPACPHALLRALMRSFLQV